MRTDNQPVYMIGVAASLCNVHPQTLRQYERLGLVIPSRAGAKNRLYSENDIRRVRRIQRLTQEMGVNLAGVELILRLLDDMEEMRRDMDRQLEEYVNEAERRIAQLLSNPATPMRRDERLLPVPNIQPRVRVDL
ncbi:heat shock protein transcriptional repressor HspR [Fimbriimonas ginsengisoli]|uniref:HspR, transcriptional repressor of DnaK operon n=1 Tax=Fimbriimonas ginsengisoli Gsoil 348 TaxID=661478 RepID=A0A068NTZ9_FIMGI|nr:MerR family transcriptional regulator [Fimbriimonas ginsengisoli]AIE86847.1 HspR, transcriptional repressor of DnaK operon [Fimbriimonas ginsengisoli Gsoil 348]